MGIKFSEFRMIEEFYLKLKNFYCKFTVNKISAEIRIISDKNILHRSRIYAQIITIF